MREYNSFQAIVMSFYSRKLYRDVVSNWHGSVILYLFLLLAVSWLAMMFVIQPFIKTGADEITTKYILQVPVVTVHSGIASTPENRPYMVKDPDNEVVAIVDTSGQYQNLSSTPVGTKVLLTKDTIYYYDSSHGVKVTPLSNTLNITLQPEQVKRKIIQFSGWLWLLVFPFALVISFIYRLAQALVYAVLGKVFAALGGIDISYSNVIKICLIAVTPAIIIATVLDMCAVTFHLEWLFYFIITMAYVIFGIGANRASNSK